MKSTQRRFFTSFVVILMLVTLGGVSQVGAQAAAKPDTLSVVLQATPRMQPVFDVAVPAFEAKYGIKVKVQGLSTDALHEQLILAMSEKNTSIDVFMFPDEWATEVIGNGWASPQDKYWDNPAAVRKNELGVLFAEPDWTNTMKQKLMLITAYPGAIILFYRTDLFAQAGLKPPQTFDQLEADAKKFNDPSKGFYGISMGFSTKGNQLRGNWMAMIGGYGGKLFDDKWKPVFNQKPGIDTALLIKRLIAYNPPAALANDYQEALTEFSQGRTAMLMLWSHAIGLMNDPSQSKVVGKVGAVPIPAGPKGRGGLQADFYYAVSSFSKNKEWGAKFIQSIKDPAMVKKMWVEGLVTPPSLISVARDPEVAKTFFVGPVLAEQAKFASGYPRMTPWEYFSEHAEIALGKIMASNDDPQKILDDLAADITVQLKQAGYVK
jgi:multiple sugar transport system substrate-binding protein